MPVVPSPYALPTYVDPAVGDPELVRPEASDPHAEPPRAPTRRLTLSTRTPAEAARGALQDTVRVFAGVSQPSPLSPGELDRWENEGGPLARTAADGDLRFPSRAAHAEWSVPSSASDVAQAAFGAYARALRHDGLGLAAALVALEAAVNDAVAGGQGRLAPAALAVLQQDAIRRCRDAYAGPFGMPRRELLGATVSAPGRVGVPVRDSTTPGAS